MISCYLMLAAQSHSLQNRKERMERGRDGGKEEEREGGRGWLHSNRCFLYQKKKILLNRHTATKRKGAKKWGGVLGCRIRKKSSSGRFFLKAKILNITTGKRKYLIGFPKCISLHQGVMKDKIISLKSV